MVIDNARKSYTITLTLTHEEVMNIMSQVNAVYTMGKPEDFSDLLALKDTLILAMNEKRD